MRKVVLASMLLPALLAQPAGAQQPSPAQGTADGRPRVATATPDMTIYMSAADVAARVAAAGAVVASGAPDTGPFSLFTQWPVEITMEYRDKAAGHSSIHTLNAELFYVLDGNGAMSVGGHLVGARAQGNDLNAAGSEGGKIYELHKGDILLVPPSTPHDVVRADGKLAMMSVHIPVGPADLWPHNARKLAVPDAKPVR